MNKNFIKLILTAGVSSLALSTTAAWTDDDGGHQDDGVEIDEIVVTALKRGEQSLLEVPLAISVFNGAELEKIGKDSMVDFLANSPGVALLEGSLQPGQLNVQIRGINASIGESMVGFYLDEVPVAIVGSSALPNISAFDLERVEVLRGPQGTLYGEGAIAGVVRMITKDPDLDNAGLKFDGELSSTKGGGTNWSTKAALNLPLQKGKWGVRLVGTFDDNSGWIDGPEAGTIDPFTGQPGATGEDVNSTDLSNIRAKLLGRPTDELTVRAMYWKSESNFDELSVSDDDSILNVAFRQPGSVDFSVANFTFEYEFENFTLMSSSSILDVTSQSLVDFFGMELTTSSDVSTFIEEARLNSNNDSDFQWTAGIYYKHAKRDFEQDATNFIPVIGVVAQHDDNKTYAAFADGSYSITDQFEISAGLRYFEETRISNDFGGFGSTDPNEAKFDTVNPRFGFAYHPNENSTIYANVAKGFRSGIHQHTFSIFIADAFFGQTLPPAAGEEKLWSYELGYKARFLDDRLTVDAAAYLNEWTDMQVEIPLLAGALSAFTNAAKAKSPGVEMALNYEATDNLSFMVSGSWNDAHIVDEVASEGIVVFPADSRINNSPEWTFNAALNYSKQINDNYAAVFYVGAQHTSERTNIAIGFSDSSDSLFKVDTRFGLQGENWGAFVFCDNCTNEDGVVFPAKGTSLPEATHFRPRTIGINLTRNF